MKPISIITCLLLFPVFLFAQDDLVTLFEKLIKQYSAGGDKSQLLQQQTILRSGTFSTSLSVSNKRTGTLDSEQGELTGKTGIIHYDIGTSTGVHMNKSRKDACVSYSEITVNDGKINIGLLNNNGKKELVITVLGDYLKFPFSFPANFWAEIKSERDIKTMLEIACSYHGN